MTDTRPDYSHVTSREQAEALVHEGKLIAVLVFPAELGGIDRVENVTYIPPAIAEARDMVIGTLQRFVADGLIDRMSVEPEYRGNSFVPIRIAFHATHSKKDGSFEPTIEIW